jgi:hypothetical protein
MHIASVPWTKSSREQKNSLFTEYAIQCFTHRFNGLHMKEGLHAARRNESTFLKNGRERVAQKAGVIYIVWGSKELYAKK